ncbi:MAG TPA: hypothetical protein VGA70_14580 [Longimicrobiales bacterium]
MGNQGDFKAQVWIDGQGAAYPEQLPPYGVGTSTGICLSGGGTRALSAGMGQLRGLNQLGLIPHIDYISCVSGGSWLSSAYTYYRKGASSDAQFLGPQTGPSGTTFQWLGQLDQGCIGFTATQSLTAALAATLALYKFGVIKSSHLIWIDSVGLVYLANYGLYDALHPHYYSLDANRVKEIVARNPQLSSGDFVTARVAQGGDPPRPYLVINSSIASPSAVTPPPTGAETLVGFEYTPLYVGVQAPLRTFDFPDSRGPSVPVAIGGGVVEPFAFGGPGPSAGPVGPPTGALVTVPDSGPGMPHRLTDATGTSSSAYVAEAEELTITGLSPLADYWPVTGAGALPATGMDFGDGGNLENFGLIALLKRGVRNIVVFVNTSTKLKNFDVKKPPATDDIDCDIPPLFGLAGCTEAMERNQVFAQEAFSTVAQGLIDARYGTTPNGTVMFQSPLAVRDNAWWGLKGGWTANVLWVYNERVMRWEGQLPADVAQAIADGNASKPSGPFQHFPNYLTMFQNSYTELVELTAEQVNLLAALSCWNVTENAATFKAFLTPTTQGEEG